MQGSYFNSNVSFNPVCQNPMPVNQPVFQSVAPSPVQQPQSYPGSQYVRSYVYPQINQVQSIQQPSWASDPVLSEAVSRLKEVKFLPGDLEHMKKLGVNPIYNSGEEAINLLVAKGFKVEFGPVSSPKCHAQWEKENNKIVINDKYKGTTDQGVILAISEALFHELGHAKDDDNISSIQEEFDCLALNTLANRYHQYYYPAAFQNTSNADIVNDGVCLYTKLFFDSDPEKQALVQRVIEKYGNLPLESPNHESAVTTKILSKLTNLN